MSSTYKDTSGQSDSYNQAAAHDTGFYDPDRHDNQIVAVFEDIAAATRARDALMAAGVPANAVIVTSQLAGDAVPGASHSEDSAVGGDILHAFMSLFTPNSDKTEYQHAVDRGHAMVVLTAAPGLNRHRAIEVLEQSGPIDFDAKLAEWRSAGYDESGAPRTAESDAADRVGRRETLSATPRIRSYVIDRPA
jgi:hypothetical protein